MTPQEAKKLLDEMTQNINLRRHGYAVAAIMRALASHFGEDEDLWEIAGYLHDADYEMFKDDPKKHPSKIFDILKKHHVDDRISQAILSHAWGWREDIPEPKTRLDWSLFACDELSGLITACALVRPEKKLALVTAHSVLKKFPQKSFAAGALREHILYCEEKLGMKLPDFIDLALHAMQEHHEELGL